MEMEAVSQKSSALQLNRLILLIISICLAVSSIILLINVYRDTTPAETGIPDPSIEIEYSLPRDARVSQNSHLAWETNFGGSLAETGGRAYEINNKIYIFGTTLSTDYDAKGGNGFSNILLSVFDINGRILSTHVFGSGHNDSFVEARVHHTGFLILVNTSRGGGTFDLYHFDTTTTKISQLQFNFPLNRTAVDLIYSGTNMLIIAEYFDTNLEKTIPYVVLLDENYRVMVALDLNHAAASLSYIACFDYYFSDIGKLGYVFFMNAIEGGEAFPCFVTLKPDGSFKFYYFERYTTNSKLMCVMPALSDSGGFIIIVSELKNGMQTRFCVLDFSFNTTASIVLPMVAADSGTICFNDTGYVISTYGLDPTQDSITSFVRFNNTLATSYIQGLSKAGKISDFCFLQDGRLVLLSTTEYDDPNNFITVLNSDSSVSSQFSFGGTKKERGLSLIEKGSRLYCFSESESSDGDSSLNFGDIDLWLCELVLKA